MAPRSRMLAAVVLAAIGTGVAAEAVHAYVLSYDRRPYRGSVVTYVAARGLQPHADRAAAAINGAHVGVTLRRAGRASPNIVITYLSSRCGQGVIGRGGLSRFNHGRVRVARGCSAQLTQQTVAHELGHALGLGHETRRCATLNPVSYSTPRGVRTSRCGVRNWIRSPYTVDDLNGLRALYRR